MTNSDIIKLEAELREAENWIANGRGGEWAEEWYDSVEQQLALLKDKKDDQWPQCESIKVSRDWKKWPKYVLANLRRFIWPLSILLACNASGYATAAEPEVIMVQTILGEARGEGFEGQKAVAEVIRNRVKADSWFKDTHEGVCLQAWQFSFWNDPREALLTAARFSAEQWQEAAKAWSESADIEDVTGGATHYCRFDVFPDWRFSKRMKFTKQIGNHVFFVERS